MECIGLCTASSYEIKSLLEFLRTRYSATLYQDVVHAEVPFGGSSASLFFFSYGVTVGWGLTLENILEFVREIKQFEVQPRKELEIDQFTYQYGSAIKVHEDEITLTNEDTLSKLAASHGIAQSVKLATYETSIQNTFNEMKHLPEELAKHGKIPLSRKNIRKKMGELFIGRNTINLHLDVLDEPEFFWEYPEVEPLYTKVSNYLDINSRVEILNQRLDVIRELFEMLANEVNNQYSSRLEWTIIVLIVIEVLLTISKDILKLT